MKGQSHIGAKEKGIRDFENMRKLGQRKENIIRTLQHQKECYGRSGPGGKERRMEDLETEENQE